MNQLIIFSVRGIMHISMIFYSFHNNRPSWFLLLEFPLSWSCKNFAGFSDHN